MTGSSYQVELFESPPPRSEWDRLDTGHRRLIESFIEGFNALGQGLAVERLSFHRDKQAVLAVRLDQSADHPIPRLNDTSATERRRELGDFHPYLERQKHGRASGRERGCKYVLSTGVGI